MNDLQQMTLIRLALSGIDKISEAMEQVLNRLDEVEARLNFFEAENVVERLDSIDCIDIVALCDRVASIERLIEDNAPPDEDDGDIEGYLESLDIPLSLHGTEP